MLLEFIENNWIWWLIQSTLIAGLSLAVLALANRMAPAARVKLALLTLIGITSLPLLSIVPSWNSLQPNSVSSQTARESVALADTAISRELSASSQFNLLDTLISTANTVNEAIQGVAVEQPTTAGSLQYRTVLAIVAFGFVLFGLARLAYGGWEVRKLIQETELCDDLRLERIVESVAREFTCKPNECRTSSGVESMALVGFRKVSLLLPSDWNSWSDSELRTALTHEFAHLERRDPLINILAQCLLAIHYYHPLAHALVRRLRMDQELAADSLAAPHVGGQQDYLCSLAGLALRRTQSRLSWATLAFLPSRRNFVRRLEMFRHLNLQHGRLHAAAVLATSLCVIAMMLGIAAWRPVIAQSTPPISAESEKSAASTQSVPDMMQYATAKGDAVIISIDVPELLSNPVIADVMKQTPAQSNPPEIFGQKISLNSVERVVAVIPSFANDRDTFVLVRLKEGTKFDAPLQRGAVEVDGRTIVSKMALSNESLDAFASQLKANKGVDASVVSLLQRHEGDTIQVVLPLARMKSTLNFPAAAAAFSPIWNETQSASIGVQFDQKVALKAIFDTTSSQRVASTLEAARTLAINAMEGLQQQLGEAPQGSVGNNGQLQMLTKLFENAVEPALTSAKIDKTSEQVTVSMQLDQSAPVLLGLLMPAVQSARQSAMRTNSMNSMRQIGLALLTYESANGHLPPSVIVENGIERSWRVELLPYLDQNELYQKYRKDRSWDSPENQLVLNNMPAIFRSVPRPEANMTPFRGIGNATGILPSTGKGLKLSEVLDGLSQTIAVVETSEMVPWTKPDRFEPTAGELCTSIVFPGGFHALFADGAVRFISEDVDERVLSGLLTIAGHEVNVGQ